MRVLAVGAHPDDLEILCAGTLLRYREQGHDVTVAIATNGNQGHFQIMPAELGEVRRKEAQSSAAILGAEFLWLDYNDQFLYHTNESRLRFIELVRQVRPDVVITHAPDDYAMDHRTVSELLFAATFMASVPHIETASHYTDKVPPLYYMDSLGGSGFIPTEYVDITGAIEKKLSMMECHQSQVKWLREHVGSDIVEQVRISAMFRGLACGVKYAEGFRHLDAWGRNPVTRVLP
jgi:LmbE family N-acetylglucosaminyl deacetylase